MNFQEGHTRDGRVLPVPVDIPMADRHTFARTQLIRHE